MIGPTASTLTLYIYAHCMCTFWASNVVEGKRDSGKREMKGLPLAFGKSFGDAERYGQKGGELGVKKNRCAHI